MLQEVMIFILNVLIIFQLFTIMLQEVKVQKLYYLFNFLFVSSV